MTDVTNSAAGLTLRLAFMASGLVHSYPLYWFSQLPGWWARWATLSSHFKQMRGASRLLTCSRCTYLCQVQGQKWRLAYSWRRVLKTPLLSTVLKCYVDGNIFSAGRPHPVPSREAGPSAAPSVSQVCPVSRWLPTESCASIPAPLLLCLTPFPFPYFCLSWFSTFWFGGK